MPDPRFISNTPPPPPHTAGGPYSSSPPPAPQPPNNQLRNIIIGAIVTICSSVLIYYLTTYMNKSKTESGSADWREMKENTVSAWRSYMAYENTYTKNLLSFEKTVAQDGMDSYIDGMNKESEKFTNDVGDLAQSKDVDKDLIKALHRRLDNEKTSLKKANDYYASLKTILAKKGDVNKIRSEFVNAELQWNRYYKGAFERAINDIQEIAKTLTEKYGQSFSMDDFLVVQIMPQRMKTNDSLIAVLQNIVLDSTGNIISNNNVPTTAYAKNVDPKDITGTWNADGDVFSLLPNGKMTWVLEDGSRASGNWKLENDKLKVNAVLEKNNQKQMWIFNLSGITGNSFTITLDASPYNTYNFVRIK
jgi:hypothetical protein